MAEVLAAPLGSINTQPLFLLRPTGRLQSDRQDSLGLLWRKHDYVIIYFPKDIHVKDCTSVFSILHGSAFVGRSGSAWDDRCFNGPERNRNKHVYWNESEFAKNIASIIALLTLSHKLGVNISVDLFSVQISICGSKLVFFIVNDNGCKI